MWECDKAKKNVVGNREWEEKDDRNSHGFWGGVQIMMLSPWMFCAHTQRERERERERDMRGQYYLIIKENEQTYLMDHHLLF